MTAPVPSEGVSVSGTKKKSSKPKPRGFATMTKAERSRIASMGGIQAHKEGRAHQFTSEEARAAGILGSLARKAKALAKATGSAA